MFVCFPLEICPPHFSEQGTLLFQMDRLHACEEDLYDALKKTKKEVRDSTEAEAAATKRKVEMEANEVRERLSAVGQAAKASMEQEQEDRKREVGMLRQQV